MTCLIWTQSVLPGSVSSTQSGLITQMISSILDKFNIYIDQEILHYLMRKIAHFTEFMILGIVWLKYVISYKTIQKKYYLIMIIPIMITAIVDEIIQIFSDARGPSIIDVLIDISGGVIVLVVYMLFKLLYNRNMKKI
jgi:VanZ family protein